MKPAWSSKTIWVNLVAAVAAVGMMFGFDLGLDAEAQTSIVTGIMAVVNVILRFTTSTAISMSTPPDPVETEPPTGV